MLTKKYLLNIGLAFTLLYPGISALLKPAEWVYFVPLWVNKLGFSQLLVLHIHAISEIILSLWLLSNWKVKWSASLITLDIFCLIVIDIFSPNIFVITFGDIGLFAIAIYLAID